MTNTPTTIPNPNAPPKTLHIFYDPQCGLCQKCRTWLESQATFFPLHFTPWDTPEARTLCPKLDTFEPWKEIVVMTDDHRIYQGATSWVMCLYATVKFRPLALKLAQPALLPFAKQICHLVSKNRYRLSSLLNLTPESATQLPHDHPAFGACPVSPETSTSPLK
ncbi:MAG: DCC1-like thiol-disulfide oxidoreductase family protein [Verrucomicrobiota bacterium]